MTPNRAQYEAWNGESGNRWVADADRRDAVLAPIAEVLLTAAEARPGDQVLDLGCGCGATTLAAARAATPGGSAAGIDLSAPMLDVARRRAANRGFANTTFITADAQTHALGPPKFDLAISRFGTMFFDDPVAALTNVAAAMNAGGRLCIVTWQPLGANDWLTVPGAALLNYAPVPANAMKGPGMFAQSDPEAVSRVLRNAGWRDISIEPQDLTIRLGTDAQDATEYLTDTGIARTILESIDQATQAEAIRAVTETLARHAGPNGVLLGAGVLIINATA